MIKIQNVDNCAIYFRATVQVSICIGEDKGLKPQTHPDLQISTGTSRKGLPRLGSENPSMGGTQKGDRRMVGAKKGLTSSGLGSGRRDTRFFKGIL